MKIFSYRFYTNTFGVSEEKLSDNIPIVYNKIN